MKNSKNTTVASILLSNNTGVGKTDSLPPIYSFTDNELTVKGYNPVELSDNLLKALFINNLHREFKTKQDLQPVLDAYSNDFLGTFHASAKDSVSPTSNPMKRAGKVLSSADYLVNCVSQKTASRDIAQDVYSILDASSQTDSTKAELQATIAKLRKVFITAEDSKMYTTILDNEEVDRVKFEVLTANGFISITRLSDDSFTALIDPMHMATMNSTLVANEYQLLSTAFDAEKSMLAVTFDTIESDTTNEGL